ncbi:MAG: ABC transporter substrate-binding protein [Clostridia bacterium]|nr:ABC transporter substrate-binding protein [Clostridia bacterium]
MKKQLLTILLLLSIILSVFSCTVPDQEDRGNTREFIDSTGRTILLPDKIEKIAVTGPIAQMVVFALAPNKLVGIAAKWDPSAEHYLKPEYYNLPTTGQLYGGKGELNFEELLNADPDVVIDVGEVKANIGKEMDALTEQTGIPFVHINATLSTFDETYTILGELTGDKEKAQTLSRYCHDTYELVSNMAASVKKKNVLYVLGSSGLNVIAKGSYHSEALDMLTNNLAVVDTPSSKGTGNEVDMEQIMLWDPDYVIFAPDSIYDNVASDDLWANISAIKAGNYYEVPLGPYNWMGFPPSSQRLLGMLWLTSVLYPEAANYDMYEKTAEYFELFYHSELTKEQYDALVGKSSK